MRKLEEVIKKLREVEEEVKIKFKAEIVGVFGSYAREEQTEESDVDVIVRFHEGATLLDFTGLADYLEQKLGVKVDLVSERAIRPELRDRILKEVITV